MANPDADIEAIIAQLSAELREVMSASFEGGGQEYASLVRTGLDRVLVLAVASKGHVNVQMVKESLDSLCSRIKNASLHVDEVKLGILAFDAEARRIAISAGKNGGFRYSSQRNAAREVLLSFANSLHR